MHLCMLYLEALYLEVILMTVTTFFDSFTSTKVQEVKGVWLGDATSTDVRINNIMTKLFSKIRSGKVPSDCFLYTPIAIGPASAARSTEHIIFKLKAQGTLQTYE